MAGVLTLRIEFTPYTHTLRNCFLFLVIHSTVFTKPYRSLVSTDEERESCQGTRLRQQFHFDIMNISSCGLVVVLTRRGRLNWHDFVLSITHVNSLVSRIPLYTSDSKELYVIYIYLKDRY